MLESGFSLKEAVLFSQTVYPEMHDILQDVSSKMAGGHSFAESIRAWVSVDTYYQMLLAEQHGKLQTTLRYFSEYIKMRSRPVRTLKHLLEYPIILIFLLGIIIFMMTVLVLPQLETIQNTNSSNLWEQIGQPVMWICGSLLTLCTFKIYYFNHLNVIGRIRQLCRLPILNKIYRDYYGYYLCSNLSLLLQEGLSLQKIITMCKTFDQDSILYQISRELQLKLINGEKGVKEYIEDEIFIPNELGVLLCQGKTTVRLGMQVQSLANHLFQRMVMQCEQKLVMVQPIIYIVIAAIITGLYLKILMPIYQTVQVMK